MAKRKRTSLTKGGFPVDPGFNLQNQIDRIRREERLRKKKKKGPSISRPRSRKVG